MPSIIPTIITITLFTLFTLSLLTHAITPIQVENGLIQGFTGEYSSHAGDYLVNTYCFCQDPAPNPMPPEAHYLQFEYYNFHHNMTYVLHQLCVASERDLITCIREGDSAGSFIMRPGKMCRTWYYRRSMKPPYNALPDTVCYETDTRNEYWRLYRHPGADAIHFNKQRRALDDLGHQGVVLRWQKEAEDKCAGLCMEHAGMPVLRGDQRAQCKILTWEDMDDMCEDCQ